MATKFTFDLVSPERSLASMEVREVQIPGADGDLTAMPDHAPTITTLRAGLLRTVTDDGSVEEFAVTGGFAEITGVSASVLAEEAVRRADMTVEMINGLVESATEVAHSAATENKDAAEKHLADLRALKDHLTA